MKTKRIVMVLAALLVAAPAIAEWPTPVDPSGPNSGAGRKLADGWPTPADPNGPNSGAGNHPFTGEPDSGAGRGLA